MKEAWALRTTPSPAAANHETPEGLWSGPQTARALPACEPRHIKTRSGTAAHVWPGAVRHVKQVCGAEWLGRLLWCPCVTLW